mmetsp:Transcript_13775/g.42686  ORF Transcript_13775/g.42686 Transcript_13775/m.42686 type:complete len:229 (+) Transcript_13775:141-827(+)
MAAIHKAARAGNVEKLRRLLAEGVSPDALVDQQVRRRPLHCLCLRDDEKNEGDRAACFELLRDAGANLEASDTGPTGNGWRPLHCAASSKSVELVSLLVQARVNVDAAGNSGVTALHLAGRRGAADCVEVLLAAGASLNLREGHGLTAFSLALLSRTNRWMWPLFLRAGAEIPTDNTEPYIVRVKNAGGFQRYAQAHLARITSILETPLLPPELVRKVLEYWLHAGYY